MTVEPRTEAGRALIEELPSFEPLDQPALYVIVNRVRRIESEARAAALREVADLIGDLAHEYHHSGLLKDHADPTDKTGWNVKGIETCADPLCREARAVLTEATGASE